MGFDRRAAAWRGWRRRSSSSARARSRHSRPSASAASGKRSSGAFNSCRQATSGRVSLSQSSRLASRPLMPLTLKVAIFTNVETIQPRRRFPPRLRARLAVIAPPGLDLAAQLHRHRHAVAVDRLAGGDADPAFGGAIFLDIVALAALEADADAALQRRPCRNAGCADCWRGGRGAGRPSAMFSSVARRSSRSTSSPARRAAPSRSRAPRRGSRGCRSGSRAPRGRGRAVRGSCSWPIM